MSLDVYLTLTGAVVDDSGPHIFIRENGETKEITLDEWSERFPGREPHVISELPSVTTDEVYWSNITHNLAQMADAAGIYTALWRPSELLDPEKAAEIRVQEGLHNYHGAGGAFEIERSLPAALARDLIEPLKRGLAILRSDPDRFRAFNPSNGWGSYEGLVSFVERYLAACEENPEATVRVSR